MKKTEANCPVCQHQILNKNDQKLSNQTTIKKAVEKPINEKKQRQKKWIILAASCVLLMILGGICFFDFSPNLKSSPLSRLIALIKNEPPQQNNNFIEGVRESYYQEGMMLFLQYTGKENREKAILVGGHAFLDYIDESFLVLKNFLDAADNPLEKTFAQALMDICLYSLSNDAQEGSVEELGGSADAQERAKLKAREEKLATIKERFEEATTQEALGKILKDLNDETI